MNNQNKKKYAVIDKISDGTATLLIGEDEKELTVNPSALPDGAKEGDWLEINSEGILSPAPEITLQREKTVRSKLDKLRKR